MPDSGEVPAAVSNPLARVSAGTRVRVFYTRDRLAESFSGTYVDSTPSDARFRDLDGSRVSIPLLEITSFTVPDELRLESERQARMALFTRVMLRLATFGIAGIVIGYFLFRNQNPNLETFILLAAVLVPSALVGLIVGTIVSRAQQPSNQSVADAVLAEVVTHGDDFGSAEAEQLTRIRRGHIQWYAIKFALGTGLLYLVTSNPSGVTDILTEVVPFTAVGAYIGTLSSRAWMEFGNYRP